MRNHLQDLSRSAAVLSNLRSGVKLAWSGEEGRAKRKGEEAKEKCRGGHRAKVEGKAKQGGILKGDVHTGKATNSFQALAQVAWKLFHGQLAASRATSSLKPRHVWSENS